MNKLFRTSIFLKIFFTMIFLVSAVLIIYSYFTVQNQKESYLTIMKTQASVTMQSYIQNRIDDFATNNQGAMIQNALEVIKSNPTILYILIHTKADEHLFIKKDSWQMLDSCPKEIKNRSFFGIINSPLHAEPTFHSTIQIKSSNVNIGWLHFGFSTKEYNRSLISSITNIGYITLFALFISILISYLFAKRLTKPIRRLQAVTQQVRKGKFVPVKFRERSSDEIDSLTENFNIMIDSIKKKQDEILLINHELEDKVQQRTQKLNQLNQELDQRVKTEVQKRTEQEKILLKQTQMNQMGDLLNNISKQYKQPLSIITAIISSANLQKELKSIQNEEFEKNYALLMQNIDYLNNSINTFDSYLNDSDEVHSLVLQEAIDEIIQLNEESFKEDFINVNQQIPDSLIFVQSTKKVLSQIIGNILINSKEALLSKDDDRQINIKIKQKDTQIELYIEDNAGGIDPRIKDKVFQPFITTKPNQKGMGLYIAYALVVNQLQGSIKFDTNREFTRCTITLPKL